MLSVGQKGASLHADTDARSQVHVGLGGECAGDHVGPGGRGCKGGETYRLWRLVIGVNTDGSTVVRGLELRFSVLTLGTPAKSVDCRDVSLFVPRSLRFVEIEVWVSAKQ